MTPATPGLGEPPMRLVAVHAHPDDETLATGVALAHHARRGDDVHVVTCTLGEEGEVIPPTLAHLEGTEELGPHRHGELAAAMAELGVSHHYLGGDPPPWRDSGMAGSAAAAHPRAFAGGDLATQVEVLGHLLVELAPDVVLTYDEHGGYRHPDHIRTHQVTCAAVAGLPPDRRPVLYAVLTPVSWAVADRSWLAEHVPHGSGLTVPGTADPFPPSVVPDDVVTHAVVDPSAVPDQVRALRHHATQVTVYDGYFALSNNIASRLAGREGYAVLDPASGRLESARAR